MEDCERGKAGRAGVWLDSEGSSRMGAGRSVEGEAVAEEVAMAAEGYR